MFDPVIEINQLNQQKQESFFVSFYSDLFLYFCILNISFQIEFEKKEKEKKVRRKKDNMTRNYIHFNFKFNCGFIELNL